MLGKGARLVFLREAGDHRLEFDPALLALDGRVEGGFRENAVAERIETSALERVFSYKAKANHEMLAAMQQFDHASPAKEIAIRFLNHTYAVDRIFAANMTGAEHGYTSPNPGSAPSLEELSEAIETSDQWYLDYVSHLDEERLAEWIDFYLYRWLAGSNVT